VEKKDRRAAAAFYDFTGIDPDIDLQLRPDVRLYYRISEIRSRQGLFRLPMGGPGQLPLSARDAGIAPYRRQYDVDRADEDRRRNDRANRDRTTTERGAQGSVQARHSDHYLFASLPLLDHSGGNSYRHFVTDKWNRESSAGLVRHFSDLFSRG